MLMNLTLISHLSVLALTTSEMTFLNGDVLFFEFLFEIEQHVISHVSRIFLFLISYQL